MRTNVSHSCRSGRAYSAGHRCLQIPVDLVEESGGRLPLLLGTDEYGQIFGHETGLDGSNRDLFQGRGEFRQRRIVVELGAVREPARPGENRGHRIGRGFAALLVFAIMPRHRAMGRLGFDHFAVRRGQHRSHQAKRAIALRDSVRLHVAIVILASPNIAARPFQRCRDHVVDQPMLVGELFFRELVLELRVEHFLENILEPAVIDFDDRILGREIERVATVERVIHRCAREIADRVVEIVHRHGDAAAGELEDFAFDFLAVVANESEIELALARHPKIGGAVLVAEGVAADDDRLGPARYQPRHVLADDRLAEDYAAENVADGAVWRAVHVMQIEFLHSRFVRCDGGAFDCNADLLGRFGRVDRDLVAGFVALLYAEIEIEQIDIEIRINELFLDVFPNDPGHLVAVHFDDWIGDFDLLHWNFDLCGAEGVKRRVWRASNSQAPRRRRRRYSTRWRAEKSRMHHSGGQVKRGARNEVPEIDKPRLEVFAFS